MSICKPGDTIIVPPASIGGCNAITTPDAGLFKQYIEVPIDKDFISSGCRSTRELALKEQPKLITLGGSLNLFEHRVSSS